MNTNTIVLLSLLLLFFLVENRLEFILFVEKINALVVFSAIGYSFLSEDIGGRASLSNIYVLGSLIVIAGHIASTITLNESIVSYGYIFVTISIYQAFEPLITLSKKKIKIEEIIVTEAIPSWYSGSRFGPYDISIRALSTIYKIDEFVEQKELDAFKKMFKVNETYDCLFYELEPDPIVLIDKDTTVGSSARTVNNTKTFMKSIIQFVVVSLIVTHWEMYLDKKLFYAE